MHKFELDVPYHFYRFQLLKDKEEEVAVDFPSRRQLSDMLTLSELHSALASFKNTNCD